MDDINEEKEKRIHLFAEEVTIEIESQKVIIQKLYGIQSFFNLRIYPDVKNCLWVIERETLLPRMDPDSPDSLQQRIWVEWCRIPGQFAWEFLDI